MIHKGALCQDADKVQTYLCDQGYMCCTVVTESMHGCFVLPSCYSDFFYF
jgi:hypothetical protein